ncbi:helix-turn-helix domain-containing protein [Amycolatopsis sp.]|uniref:winged helix-turn-helix transcriptional regulator n=1 Tax=Amycolatopsis sp. TaxID=37632 RepID=UPI002BAAAC4D|nr:helix-turn-helix domain-containing protein [Amycolatopsis sp.]HVV12037.1 helix-turn-helix domain-containing protein [Amycolatopsis sp.]
MSSYGQLCPVAKAAELLDQRWMLLVVRELVAGSTRFNEIHRGVPQMSRTLLSRRLSQLRQHDVVSRQETPDGPVYQLTDAGEELRPVVEALGTWGVRWLRSLAEEDRDPAFLVWDMSRNVNTDALPDHKTVLALTFPDATVSLRHWWLILSRAEVDICDEDPGLDTDVHLTAPLRVFVPVWRGDLPWHEAVVGGELELQGAGPLVRAVPRWFRLGHFAAIPRP